MMRAVGASNMRGLLEELPAFKASVGFCYK
jgi:hypothetical protein